MDVIKLLRCFWQHPIPRNRFVSVNYYVIYERSNHVVDARHHNYGGFRMVSEHTDGIDEEICSSLTKVWVA
jgi:hypothetical protein